MFTQLFGKYLVGKNVLTAEEDREIHDKLNETRVKLGTIAVADGIITEKQAEEINRLQTQQDKRFGDIAIDLNYITPEQLDEILSKQGNVAMKYFQILNETKGVSMDTIDEHVKGFQKEVGLTDNELAAFKADDYNMLVSLFATVHGTLITDLASLVMRNITRFVTSDFYFSRMKRSSDYSYVNIAGQKINGDYSVYLGFATPNEPDGIIELAKGYAKDIKISGSDEIYDAICEFANLNNGLLSSERSFDNKFSDMTPPQVFLNQTITGTAYIMPIYIHDKRVDLVISTDADFKAGEKPHALKIAKNDNNVATDADAKKIMIVDDSSLIRKMLRQLLEKNGYSVVAEAENGQEAADMYASVKPDLVTLDVTMPVLDGVGALKKIKEIDSSAKVIMVTATGQKDRIIDALKNGALAFITKPFDEEDLLKNLNNCL